MTSPRIGVILICVSLCALAPLVPTGTAAQTCGTPTHYSHTPDVVRHDQELIFTVDFINSRGAACPYYWYLWTVDGVSSRCDGASTGYHFDAAGNYHYDLSIDWGSASSLSLGAHTVEAMLVMDRPYPNAPPCTPGGYSSVQWPFQLVPCHAYAPAGADPAYTTFDSQPMIQATFQDPNAPPCGTPTHGSMTLDGVQVVSDYDGMAISYRPPQPLLSGPHQVSASVQDPDGVTTTMTWNFNVAPSFSAFDVGTGSHTTGAGSPSSVTIPREAIGPLNAGPYTQPLPAVGAWITLGDRSAHANPSGTFTVPRIDVQRLVPGEPLPLSLCEPGECTFPVPGITPSSEGDSITLQAGASSMTYVLP